MENFSVIFHTDQFSISITSDIETVMGNKFTTGESATVTFTAIVNSIYKNNFTYQWQKRRNRLPDKVSSVNEAVLTIPSVLKSDEGKYYCTVTNEWGRNVKSKDVTLSVKGKKIMCKSTYVAMLYSIGFKLTHFDLTCI